MNNLAAVTASEVAWFAAAAAVGYFIGAINPASIIARAKGIDLKASGSGNPGATNAGRIMGRRTGILVAVLDVLKGVLPVLLFLVISNPRAALVAGFFAIIGHMTSPFLHGRGGKGVATMLGVLLAAYPLWLLPVLVAAAVGYLIFKRAGLASVTGALALIVTALVDRTGWELTTFGVLIGALVIFRHQRNIRAAWVDWRASRDARGGDTPVPS